MDSIRRLASPDIERTDRSDGSIVLRNRTPLPDPLPDILDRFDHWVAANGEAAFVSDCDGTQSASWVEIDRRSDAAAARLKGMGFAVRSSVAVIANAGIDHAVLKVALLKIGLTHVPLSPVLAESPFGRTRLAALLAIAKPALILVEDTAGAVVRALASIANAPIHQLGELTTASDTARFERPRHEQMDPAAIYFTSGSTGEPKGVTITRGMIASNQAAYAAHWPFLTHQRPVLLDWLPWHHVFGGLDNFFKMVWNGGEYHVDTAPSPERVETMAARLRAVRPTLHINVPFGIGLLLDRLDADSETRDAFFSRLDVIFFAGAGMDLPTWTRLNETAAKAENTPTLVSGYGMTEAASTICLGLEPAQKTSEIGFPLPGHTIRLVPVEVGETSWEIRVRGPNVAPRYVTAGGEAPLPLDEDGFLSTGDLAGAARDDAPERGLVFDGRLAEDFKLTTGTRVKTGALRYALLEACAPDLADVAIAGESRTHLTAILFVKPTTGDKAAQNARLETALAQHNARLPGGSTAIRHAIVAIDAPNRSKGEINDKGHLVQRRTLANRATLVDRLYANRTCDTIILPMENLP